MLICLRSESKFQDTGRLDSDVWLPEIVCADDHRQETHKIEIMIRRIRFIGNQLLNHKNSVNLWTMKQGKSIYVPIEYVDETTGRRVAEVNDLSFLSNWYGHSWLRRHRLSRRNRKACKRADIIIVPDKETAASVVRYYFVSKDKIVIR